MDLIEKNMDHIHRLCEKYKVESMYIFGSASTGEFGDQSDIDVLVSFKELSFELYTDNYFLLHTELEALFDRKVDLLTERSLTNPFFIKSVEETKKLVYAA